MLKYLITGTGRCGTVYLARLLTSVGIPCGHESIFDFNGWDIAVMRMNGEKPVKLSYCSTHKWENKEWAAISEWLPKEDLQAESSYMAAPYIDKVDATKIHVVRSPVKVVNSFCHGVGYFKSLDKMSKYEEFVYSFLPELKVPMTQYDRACMYYVLWNEMIEKKCPGIYRFRVEDPVEHVLEFIGVNTSDYFSDRRTNSLCDTTHFCVDMISDGEVKSRFVKIAYRYGYNLNNVLL